TIRYDSSGSLVQASKDEDSPAFFYFILKPKSYGFSFCLQRDFIAAHRTKTHTLVSSLPWYLF
ncbi:unnamed protein product, partial [Arabidopsis halleri]